MFPPVLDDYVRRDGAVVVPARVAEAMIRLLTLGVTEGRLKGIPVNTDMVVVLDALQRAAMAEDAVGSDLGTMVGDPVSVVVADVPLVTAGQAAERLGCTARAITKAIENGKLLGRKVGHQWLIREQDFDTYRFGKGIR
jgi:excisionase family DNA binding protein